MIDIQDKTDRLFAIVREHDTDGSLPWPAEDTETREVKQRIRDILEEMEREFNEAFNRFPDLMCGRKEKK